MFEPQFFFLAKVNVSRIYIGVGTFSKGGGGGRPQRLKTSPTPKIHFLLGFRPLYFRKHAQIGKKKRDKKKKSTKKLCDRFALTNVIIDTLVT